MKIVTVGGYGFTEATFLGALKTAGVDTFVDIRRRRGMRGAKYAFLNSSRLQALLAAEEIRYEHALDLAPTASVRDAQTEDDRAMGTAKCDRAQLAPAFVQKYRSEILAKLDIDRLRNRLSGARTVVLFCVEGNPLACHRSLAAEHLVGVLGTSQQVEHLAP